MRYVVDALILLSQGRWKRFWDATKEAIVTASPAERRSSAPPRPLAACVMLRRNGKAASPLLRAPEPRRFAQQPAHRRQGDAHTNRRVSCLEMRTTTGHQDLHC